MESMIITPTQAAKVLHIRRATVYELCEDGELEAYKQGNRWKILKRSIQEYAERMARNEWNHRKGSRNANNGSNDYRT